jgi:hypothetical protein
VVHGVVNAVFYCDGKFLKWRRDRKKQQEDQKVRDQVHDWQKKWFYITLHSGQQITWSTEKDEQLKSLLEFVQKSLELCSKKSHLVTSEFRYLVHSCSEWWSCLQISIPIFGLFGLWSVYCVVTLASTGTLKLFR